MTSLYREIEKLNMERNEVHNQLTAIEHSLKIDKKSLAKVNGQYMAIDRQIKEIEKAHKIGIHEMNEMLNNHTGKKYKLKVFQEMRFYNGKNNYTRHFVACYLNRNHPYYSKKDTEIIYLFPHEYTDLIHSLTPANAIIFSSDDSMNFEPIDPYMCLETVNYTHLLTRGYIDEGLIKKEFIEKVAPLIRLKLEQTLVENEEQDLNYGI